MPNSLDDACQINIEHAYWNADDRKQVSNIFDRCCEKIAEQHRAGNFQSVMKLNKLISGIPMIEQMMAAFRDTPRYVIRGENGVAAKLGLTRNGVYARLVALGLQPDDFTSPRATVADLIEKSDALADALRELGRSPHKVKNAPRTPK
jgi:hypothetical protein